MKPKRLIAAFLGVFVVIWISDMLNHGLLMDQSYKNTAHLWRTEPEMVSHMAWLFLGQALTAATFVTIYAIGFAPKRCLKCALMFGLFMGLFQQSKTVVMYAVQPLPAFIVMEWILQGLIQGILMGADAFFILKSAVPSVPNAAPEPVKTPAAA